MTLGLEAQRQKASERRSSKLAGRNMSEARAGPERAIVEADLAHIQGRPCVQREG